MKHFEFFPQIEYNGKTATNLLVRARVRELVLENTVSYYNYSIRDGDRPDLLSLDYYGSVNFTWVILYANNIFDVFYDWPLGSKEFDKYIESKYGSVQNTQSLADESLILTLSTGTGIFNPGQTVFQGDSLPLAISKAVVTDWNPVTRRLRLKDVEGDFHPTSGNVRNAANTVSYSILRRRNIISHYEITKGMYAGTIISKQDFLDPLRFIDEGKRPVTIYEDEYRRNEAKRNIKLIKPSEAYTIANDLKLMFR